MDFSKEYFNSPYYFYIKEGKNDIYVYFNVSNTLTEARKKDEVVKFDKKHKKEIVKELSKIQKDKKLKTSEKVSRMSEITDIFDGHVRIFKTTNSGDVYQMRMYVQEEKRYIRKSLKTRDKQLASSLAQREFITYQSKILNGEKLFSLTANEMRERYLKYVQTLVDENQISIGRQSKCTSYHSIFFST
jgi:hypothetical protein